MPTSHLKNPERSPRTLTVVLGVNDATLTWSHHGLDRKNVTHFASDGDRSLIIVITGPKFERKGGASITAAEAKVLAKSQVLHNDYLGSDAEVAQIRRIMEAQGLTVADRFDILTALHLLP